MFSRTYKLGITMPAVHLFLGYVCVLVASAIYRHAKTDTDHIIKSEKPTMLKFSTENKTKSKQPKQSVSLTLIITKAHFLCFNF